MSAQHWSSVVDNTSDAGFRAWGSEFAAKLAATSLLVQTADTGQIDWTTVAVPGGSSDAGYEIWKFNDSLFGTAPVYFRITYGSNGSSQPNIKIRHGTATDGAGTLSGATLTPVESCTYAGGGPASTTTPYDSYVCAVNGFFGFWWKGTPASGTPGGSATAFYYQRTCDATGAPTAEGAHFYAPYGTGYGTYAVAIRYAATATLFTANSSAKFCCAFQYQPSTIDDSGNSQAFVHYTVTPSVAPMIGTCTVLAGEVPQGTTFTATLVGSTSHTYIATRPSEGGGAETTASGSYAMAMLWE